MSEFCFANVARIMKRAYLPSCNSDQKVVESLLGWAMNLPEVHSRRNKKEPIKFTPSTVSDLMNRNMDIPASIIEAIAKDSAYKLAVDNATVIADDMLNQNLEDEMYNSLLKLIDEESDASDQRKKELHELRESDVIDFLARVIIYAISVPNKREDDISLTHLQNLLFECNNRCPICSRIFVEPKPGELDFRPYEVVQIYPSGKVRQKKLPGISKPDNLYSQDNQIILCLDHAKWYEENTSPENYVKLRDIKERLESKLKAMTRLGRMELEPDISKIVNALSSMSAQDIESSVKLSMEAVRVQNKLDGCSQFFISNVRNNVVNYYDFVEKQFQNIDRSNSGLFTVVAQQIKLAYTQLEAAGLSKHEIYVQIARWLKDKAGLLDVEDMAYTIIVDFFIQNCEVFSAVSK